MFSLRVWGSIMGKTVQTPIIDDVKDENPVVRLRANQEEQISCGQMLLLRADINKETRKSSSAGVSLVGRNLKKHLQENRRSSPEAVQKRSCVQRHWERQKGKDHRCNRKNMDRKIKHIDVAHLWLQDEVKSNRLRVRRVKSEHNLADIGTKALSNKIIRKHATSMGYDDVQENLRSRDVTGL